MALFLAPVRVNNPFSFECVDYAVDCTFGEASVGCDDRNGYGWIVLNLPYHSHFFQRKE